MLQTRTRPDVSPFACLGIKDAGRLQKVERRRYRLAYVGRYFVTRTWSGPGASTNQVADDRPGDESGVERCAAEKRSGRELGRKRIRASLHTRHSSSIT